VPARSPLCLPVPPLCRPRPAACCAWMPRMLGLPQMGRAPVHSPPSHRCQICSETHTTGPPPVAQRRVELPQCSVCDARRPAGTAIELRRQQPRVLPSLAAGLLEAPVLHCKRRLTCCVPSLSRPPCLNTVLWSLTCSPPGWPAERSDQCCLAQSFFMPYKVMQRLGCPKRIRSDEKL